MSDRNQPADPLPKTDAPEGLPGVVRPQFVRCGKPACRCASGDPADRHGPYYYRFWRERGRLRKRYVRPADLDATRAACARRQARERARREARRDLRARLADFRTRAREVERLLAVWRHSCA